jgi:hypothetical protein
MDIRTLLLLNLLPKCQIFMGQLEIGVSRVRQLVRSGFTILLPNITTLLVLRNIDKLANVSRRESMEKKLRD